MVRFQFNRLRGFTLIELLVVVGIISLLISILMPSLSRARDQAKGVQCLARMHDYANALAAYINTSNDSLPPAEWTADECCDDSPGCSAKRYGWQEILFHYVYRDKVAVAGMPACDEEFPVQRNIDGDRWSKYFLCKASSAQGVNSGHYRVYLPFWALGTWSTNSDGTFDETSGPIPTASVSLDTIRPRMILLGDANERSHRGDGDPQSPGEGNDCSYIDAGEADESGPNGFDGNRFSDRHYGGTNFLFQDSHAEWETGLKRKLARDWDLNNVPDVEEAL